MCGIPTPPCRILYSLLSYNNWGCLAFCDSNFTATSWKWQTQKHLQLTAPVKVTTNILAHAANEQYHVMQRVATSAKSTEQLDRCNDRLVSLQAMLQYASSTCYCQLYYMNIRRCCSKLNLPLHLWCWWPDICHRKIPIQFFWQACIFHRLWIRLWSHCCSP